MKNYTKTLFLATALCIGSEMATQAGKLTIINNIPNKHLQLFIRGVGNDSYRVWLLEAGKRGDFIVNKEYVRGKELFEVTASTGNGGSPDWKLMGGTCSDLVTDADHTLVIDSTLGKISCKNVTAANPVESN